MADKPNILVLWGDDIGYYNISHNNKGAMGYRTPNIDRVAQDGLDFTDYYAQQSCTAGRAAFITGQNPLRTGLTKVGTPGAPLGLQHEDPTIAALLKPLGYTCGQFGKNHLGDRDEFLPTAHGFDEFFGNLYHLNAEEEPEHPDYPHDSPWMQDFKPRGVIHSWAQPDGTQRIEDTGPLTKKRMETIDTEITEAAVQFMESAAADGTPFFLWWNATHMHFRTHVRPEDVGRTGQGFYADAMAYHDELVGVMLDKLDELGLADNTIVMYSTDNGPHYNAWPDGAITPWRSEKNTNWEGAYRVPCFLRWPGKLPAGEVRNGIVSHQDMLPTFLAAAGEPTIKDKLREGHTIGETTYKVHIDGYDMSAYLTGEAEQSPRLEYFYVNDDAQLVALRYQDWKIVFMEQRAKGMAVWSEPFVGPLRVPKMFHLRRDPFERADESSNTYWDWVLDHAFLLYPAQKIVATYAQSLIEFPPRQKPSSFNVSEIAQSLDAAAGGS